MRSLRVRNHQRDALKWVIWNENRFAPSQPTAWRLCRSSAHSGHDGAARAPGVRGRPGALRGGGRRRVSCTRGSVRPLGGTRTLFPNRPRGGRGGGIRPPAWQRRCRARRPVLGLGGYQAAPGHRSQSATPCSQVAVGRGQGAPRAVGRGTRRAKLGLRPPAGHCSQMTPMPPSDSGPAAPLKLKATDKVQAA